MKILSFIKVYFIYLLLCFFFTDLLRYLCLNFSQILLFLLSLSPRFSSFSRHLTFKIVNNSFFFCFWSLEGVVGVLYVDRWCVWVSAVCTFFHLVRMVQVTSAPKQASAIAAAITVEAGFLFLFFTLTLHIKDFFFIFPKFFIKILFAVILFINYFCVTFFISMYIYVYLFIYLFQLLSFLNQYHFFFFHFYLSFSLVCLCVCLIYIFSISFFFRFGNICAY